MQAFLNFRQHIHRLLNSNSSVGDTTFIVKHLEDEASNLCLSFDTQIQSLRDDLLAKDNELIKTMQERFNLLQELNTNKDSAHTIIKCLNISLKASSHTIARTIIEMIAREHLHSMNLAIEKLMDKLRREKNYANHSWSTIDLIKEAKKRTFWDTMTVEQQKDADLLVKWHSQGSNKKNFVPTKDILKRMWENLKSTDIVTTLKHPKYGSFSDKNEQIEKAFINLYKTLSEAVHNCGLCYEEDVLPIPDIIENIFSKSDALALATFYS
ncbi:unnamed protein product [Rotaria sordida]|uniref:Uncharacterized protein n=1 Tax=Rotaria sordida TaxID=392033 RepID=A0A814H972_9BILA|nr:unnamed protein product [Rotaria sordida]CAF4079095.1 unnamed protein product [Rotaria sordida]